VLKAPLNINQRFVPLYAWEANAIGIKIKLIWNSANGHNKASDVTVISYHEYIMSPVIDQCQIDHAHEGTCQSDS